MALDIAQIISEFGPFINNGQNRKDLKKKLFQAPETAKIMTSYRTQDSFKQLAYAKITEDFIQRFQQSWTPKGGVSITPNKLELNHIKIDLEFNPYSIVDTWLEFLREGALNPVQFPLIAYLLQEHVIPGIQSDLELKGIFKGSMGTLVPGTATTGLASMDGLKKKIIAGVKDGTINKISLGTLSAATIFEKVEEFVDGIEELYQDQNMSINMSDKWERLYKRDRRGSFNYPVAPDDSVDFTPQTVNGLASMSGEDIIWCTPKENMFYLVKDETNQSIFQIEGTKRLVNVYTDFSVGVGFAINQAVWAYVPESLLV